MLLFAVVLGGGSARAQSTQSPEQVVQAFTKAWGDGDRSALLALFADDTRGYDRSSDSHSLTGKLSDTIGSKDRLAAYYEAASAKPPLSRETILESATVGELVIASGESVTPPSGARMSFLTGYRIRDGRIHDLWHLAWTHADTPARRDSVEVIKKLIAASDARDADRFLALFGRGARHFRYSDNPHVLAGTPSDTVVDDASRDRYVRKHFAGRSLKVRTVKVFAVGDLAVVQSHVSGLADAPENTVNTVSIYRIRHGRIVDAWLVGEETFRNPLTAMQAVAADNDAEEAVRKSLEALSAGDVGSLAAVFAPQLSIHHVPTEAHTIVGRRADEIRTREELRAYFAKVFVAEPPARHEVVGMVSLDEHVVLRVAIHTPDGTPPDHALTAFRVRDGLIEAIWHIASEADADRRSGAAAQTVIRQLTDANNRGDADGFVALYHADAWNFHSRHDPTRLGGAPPARRPDRESRRRFYRELYASGPPAPVGIIDSVALGEWVATRERYAATPNSPARDHLNIYRVRDGLILDDWHVAP